MIEPDSKDPQLFTGGVLNILTETYVFQKSLRNFSLHSKQLLTPKTQFFWYRKRDMVLAPYFPKKGE